MGTRNLTMVIMNGKTKVAQYGQWDGYPEGQGKTALKFLKSVDLDKFKERLKSVRLATRKDNLEKKAFLESIGSKDGWLTGEQSALYNKKYRFDSRDHAAEILQMIMDSPEDKIVLQNNESFAGDSLFCEWAYVIDLDKNVFEVYSGFNKQPLTESDRFYKLTDKKEEYKPVKLAASFPLDQLPEEKEFIAQFESVEENEDAE